jgi:protein-S-isoprenylcysteine O-methyltransferase Ste14
MVNALLGSLLVLAIAVISAISYDHRGREYAHGKTQIIRSVRGFNFVYRYIRITTISVTIACYFTRRAALFQLHHSVIWMYAGLGIAVIATGLFVWAKRALGSQYSPCSDSFVPERIIQHGPYRWLRHPIYAANLLLLGGLFISCGSLWVVANMGILAFYYVLSARNEETSLSANLPDYAEYLRSTGALIPRLRQRHRPTGD